MNLVQIDDIQAKEQYEMLIVPSKYAYEHRDDLARLIEKRAIRVPILYTVDQAIDMVAADRMQLWLFRVIGDEYPCLAMLTEIMEYPAGRSVNICLMVGEKLWPITRKFMIPFLAWCKLHKADYVEATTHPSISRMLMKYGFVPTGVRLHFSLATMQ
jgi:hypothetical protein